jgi:hypothetical protein
MVSGVSPRLTVTVAIYARLLSICFFAACRGNAAFFKPEVIPFAPPDKEGGLLGLYQPNEGNMGRLLGFYLLNEGNWATINPRTKIFTSPMQPTMCFRAHGSVSTDTEIKNRHMRPGDIPTHFALSI